MRKEGARETLKKRLVSMTEERVAALLAWTRSRRTKRARRGQTPLQEFKGDLESMTNEQVTEMVEGTRPKQPGYLASLMRLPALVLKAIAGRLGWHQTEKQSG
jgi:hypothetical protein